MNCMACWFDPVRGRICGGGGTEEGSRKLHDHELEKLSQSDRATHYPPMWSGALLHFKFHLLFRLSN